MPFKALLLDIEGTITSISFVKDELFPYAFDNVDKYLENHFDAENVKKIIEDLRELTEEQRKTDYDVRPIRDSKKDIIEDISHNVRHWIKLDKKLTPMKALQGLIWKEAYESGAVKGHLYPDVLPVLSNLSVPIFIYSSGSVQAQKLLFANSIGGDVTKILSGYFDTNIGLKGDAASYFAICKEIGQEPWDVLFLTDVEAEARAALSSGLQSFLIIREENAPLSQLAKDQIKTITNLEQIL